MSIDNNGSVHAPAGIPTGGQFTAGTKTEDNISLPVEPAKELTPAEQKALDMVKRNPAKALELFLELGKAMEQAQFKELKIVTVKDDGETYEGMRCPKCRMLVEDGDLEEIGYSVNSNVATYVSVDERFLETEAGDETEGRHLAWRTTCCEIPVSLPAEFRV